jgi:hypothetical protein
VLTGTVGGTLTSLRLRLLDDAAARTDLTANPEAALEVDIGPLEAEHFATTQAEASGHLITSRVSGSAFTKILFSSAGDGTQAFRTFAFFGILIPAAGFANDSAADGD